MLAELPVKSGLRSYGGLQMKRENKLELQRIDEFDLYKGIAIILVVCGHLIMSNWENAIDKHPVYTWIYSFHMPLFFFVSGFLIDYTFINRSVLGSLKKRFLSLMIPYVVWCFIIAPSVNNRAELSFIHVFVDTNPRYWFVYLLFLYSAFYYIAQGLCKCCRVGFIWGIFVSFLVLGIAHYFFPCEFFGRGIQFYPIYVYGVLASAFRLHNRDVLYKEPFLSMIFALFIVSSMSYCHLDHEILNKLCKLLASFSICFLALYYINGRYLSTNNRIINYTKYIGKNSIVVYLTHFFFLQVFPLPLVEDSSPKPFWTLFLCLLFSLVIIAICLLIGKIVESFKWINRLVYGRGW